VACAAITLAASIGFNVLALAIQYERLVSRAALLEAKGGAP
jgi:hypothetical protein